MVKELTGSMIVDWHSMNDGQVIQYLQTRFEGLTDREANERLTVYGFNKIKAEKGISKAAIFAKQMKEPLIIILLVATTISAFVGDLVDAIIIVAIVILSIIVGFIQESSQKKP